MIHMYICATLLSQGLSEAMFAAEGHQREEGTQMSPFRIPPIPTGPLSQVYPRSSGSDQRTRGHAGPRVPPTQLHSTQPPFPALPLPSLSTATKAEQYTRVVAFDRRALKRHKAHQRNAMKTTENLEQVFRELNEVCTFQIRDLECSPFSWVYPSTVPGITGGP